jgi:hypothetical protein
MGSDDLAVRVLDDGVVAIAGDADLFWRGDERAFGERHGLAGYQNRGCRGPAAKGLLDEGRALPLSGVFR